jgi:hypothetical protein
VSLLRPAVALMQPTFLPWQGYFALVANADHFVFLDDFQFVRRSFMHRNRLFLAPNNPGWISLPVEHVGRAALNEVRPLLRDGFSDKFLACLRHSYAKSTFLEAILPQLQGWMGRDWPSLSELNIAFIEMAAGWLGFQPRFLRSSQIGSEGKRSWRLAGILRRLEARTYLSARGSYAYMVEDGVFPLPDVETRFQLFQPQAYPQRQAEAFVPYLSVLDALLQVGPERARELVLQGQQQFAPWLDMTALSHQLPAEPQEVSDDQSR